MKGILLLNIITYPARKRAQVVGHQQGILCTIIVLNTAQTPILDVNTPELTQQQ